MRRFRPGLTLTMLTTTILVACAADTSTMQTERSGTAARTPWSSIDDNWRNEPQARNANPYMRQ